MENDKFEELHEQHDSDAHLQKRATKPFSGLKFKQLREEKGLTQEQLAERLRVSQQSIEQWESEESQPTTDELIRMIDFFDLPVDPRPDRYVHTWIDSQGREVKAVSRSPIPPTPEEWARTEAATEEARKKAPDGVFDEATSRFIDKYIKTLLDRQTKED